MIPCLWQAEVRGKSIVLILSSRWFDLIDLDAGQLALGQKTIEEMGGELFSLILDVASGERQVACDKTGLHYDLVLFNPGPVT